MTYILGLSGLPSENPAAALIKDGKLIAMAEEERFNRIKHSRGFPFPEKSIEFCLKQAKIGLNDLEGIGVGWASPKHYLMKEFSFGLRNPSMLFNMATWFKVYNRDKSHPFFKKYKASFHLHHPSHASSCFHVSGFKNANIITMDGKGETTSTLLSYGKNSKDIEIIKDFDLLNSIGALYESFTDYLGFRRHSHEGKVMGLASYGTPIYDTNGIIKYTKDGYRLDLFQRRLLMLRNLYRKLHGKKVDSLNYLLEKNFGPKRNKTDPLTKRHENLAATVQNIQEKVVVKLGEYLSEKTGSSNFCLAGGSSLNCVSNGVLLEQEFVKDIFIQPASSDSGTAIGAAYLEWIKLTGKKSNFRMNHAYWGPEYSDDEIEAELKKMGLKYTYYKDIEGTAAKLISKGKILGWFQGRMEIGPRALGNRSIIASPKFDDMADKVNIKVKHREPWRPFAPSLLLEAADEYLENPYPSPFMILSSRVKREKWKEIPSVVHIDGTTRPQTVRKQDNPRYHKLIKEFEKLTGTPVILNTSFNDKEEPLVCSPKDALRCLSNTALDYVAIGNFLVKKQN